MLLCGVISKLSSESKGHRDAVMSASASQAEGTVTAEAPRWAPA